MTFPLRLQVRVVVPSITTDSVISFGLRPTGDSVVPLREVPVSVLDVDWGDLELAFRDATGTPNYLDVQSGEVVSVVPGFGDAGELRELIQRQPERFAAIAPIDAGHARHVMGEFLGRLPADQRRRFAAAGLRGSPLPPGGLTKCLALLREDEALLQSYYRFEQASFWRHVEAFLASAGVTPASRAPGVELFEDAGSA